jgi:hypothetical protein
MLPVALTRCRAKWEVTQRVPEGCKPPKNPYFPTVSAAPRGYPAAKTVGNGMFWERLHLSQALTALGL